MARHGVRRAATGLLSGLCAVGMTLTTATPPALADDVALVMGGTGTPLPPASWIDFVDTLYLQPRFSGYAAQPLFTPEQLYPATGLNSLGLTASVSQGIDFLDEAIHRLVGNGNPDGNNVVVFGASQSAVIASLEIERLVAAGETDLPLSFVLVANELTPNGGILSRFSGLDLPWLGMFFYHATSDDAFPTRMYSIEYDGFVDFPRYPLNIVSVLNAIMGIMLLHGSYGDLTPEQVAGAIQLTTEGPTQTTYYMIPTEDLPLLEPLRLIPGLGAPLADLLQPALKVLVNLGYGDPDYGYSTAPANIATGFGLFPDVDPGRVFDDLADGVRQGIHDAGSDIEAMLAGVVSQIPDVSAMEPAAVAQALADAVTASARGGLGWAADAVADLSKIVGSVPNFLQTAISVITQLAGTIPAPSLVGLTEAVGGALAGQGQLLSVLANLALSLAISIPTYDINLFLSNIEEGDLIGAIGEPLAANVGLLSTASGFALGAVALGIGSVIESVRSGFDAVLDLAAEPLGQLDDPVF